MKSRPFARTDPHRPVARRAALPELVTLEPRRLLAADAPAQAYGQLPLSFEANQGQTDPQVAYLARGAGYTLFLTPAEAVLRLHAPGDAGAAGGQGAPDAVVRCGSDSVNAVLRTRSPSEPVSTRMPPIVWQFDVPGTQTTTLVNRPLT